MKDFNRPVIGSPNDALNHAFYARTKKGTINPIYPQVDRRLATVSAKTADYTVLAASDLDKIFSNTGASGTVVLTLPKASDAKGHCLTINLLAAQIVRALPVTGEAVNLNGSAVVTKYLNIAAVIGNYVDLYSDGVQWIVTGYSGVVTKEA